jgi:hypothetical protein
MWAFTSSTIFGEGRFQQLAVSGVSYGFLMHDGIHDRGSKFFLGDELKSNHHFHGAGKHFFNTFSAKCFAKAP